MSARGNHDIHVTCRLGTERVSSVVSLSTHAWVAVVGLGVGIASSAIGCSDDPAPWEISTGGSAASGSGANGGSGAIGAGASGAGAGPGSGAGTGDGGNPPAPVFDLPCGGDSCDQGDECCLEELGGETCTAAGECVGVPLACDDQDDCNAGGGEPEVCCAIFEMDVLVSAQCTHKGDCSAAGTAVVCKSLEYCDECAEQPGLPDGWMTCGPP
jgi:hypothetical protein